MGGDEVQTALITLERNRRTFAWKCWGVDSAGLTLRLGRSAVTPGGLLKHLGVDEELSFQTGLAGSALLAEIRAIDHDATWETWAWESADDDDPDALRDLWVRAVHRSRATIAGILAESGLDHAAPLRNESAATHQRHHRGVRPPHRRRRPVTRSGRRDHR